MNDVIFPDIADGKAFRFWRHDTDQWRGTVLAICAQEKLPAGTLMPFATGTNLVVALDDRLVLKIFPPIFRGQFEAEVTTLRQLAGRLPVAIPSIVAVGEIEAWTYLCMTRLQGVVGSEVWPALDRRGRERLLFDIGETIAAVQAVPPGPIGKGRTDWPGFIEGQIAQCFARHQAQGLSTKHLDDLRDIIAGAPPLMASEEPAVILTGEYIPENFLLRERDGGWRISGLFDFGDVMTGPCDYDLLGPSAFMSAGEPALVRALVSGFGYNPGDVDGAWRDRLFMLMILHRASDLRNVAIEDWPGKVGHLRELADLIWPV
ncbi:MAG: aminoglycoside 3'-phosphotransferase/choline kinase family protein [Neorhizobium sp.]|nr:aminoglycoside 3'-phosphotransferase/choline kinase family protein [Neorhizobium sp.]